MKSVVSLASALLFCLNSAACFADDASGMQISQPLLLLERSSTAKLTRLRSAHHVVEYRQPLRRHQPQG